MENKGIDKKMTNEEYLMESVGKYYYDIFDKFRGRKNIENIKDMAKLVKEIEGSVSIAFFKIESTLSDSKEKIFRKISLINKLIEQDLCNHDDVLVKDNTITYCYKCKKILTLKNNADERKI